MRSATAVALFAMCVMACDSSGPGKTSRHDAATSASSTPGPPPLSQACDEGSDDACERLLAQHLSKRSYAGNRAAASLAKRLCESDRKYFCPTYAFALARGDGVAADLDAAKTLFDATCQHDPLGCGEYGSLYAGGIARITPDLSMARFLLGLACKHKDERSCRDLQTISGDAGAADRR
jgi:TPR repeat protein